MRTKSILTILFTLSISIIACSKITTTLPVTDTAVVLTKTTTPQPTSTRQTEKPTSTTEEQSNEPFFISGELHYTSPFFGAYLSAAFVLLEDETGFIQRNEHFTFTLKSQVIGPVEVIDDETLSYQLELPAHPQATLNDLDHDGIEEPGLQVFAIAFWSNTWGGPFLEPRDGAGWSTGYASTTIDENNDGEINGGTLVIWAPDDQQDFPSGFGDDGKLFTDDDPVTHVPAGYSIVDLNQTPFKIYKEAEPKIDLFEGNIQINDYSDLSYQEAFDAMFKKVSKEYPFTKEKGIDWDALYNKYEPEIKKAQTPKAYRIALYHFIHAIPDAHVSIEMNENNFSDFFDRCGGGLGMVLTELSDRHVIISQIIDFEAADQAGLTVGTEIIKWNGKPIQQAISEVNPYLETFSSDHTRHLAQITYLTRSKPGTQVTLTVKPQGKTTTKNLTLISSREIESLMNAILEHIALPASPPIEGMIIPSLRAIGYIKINSFSEDRNLTAHLWTYYYNQFLDANVDAIIIDIRTNGGGSIGLASDIAGYFFDKETPIGYSSYYNEEIGAFETSEYTLTVKPAPKTFSKSVAVLVGPNCVSACEGFAYEMSLRPQTIIVGQYPTAGAYGEVARGQYKLPEDIKIQFPTGRSESLDGSLLIEGTGVAPTLLVPVLKQAVLKGDDVILNAAILALLK